MLLVVVLCLCAVAMADVSQKNYGESALATAPVTVSPSGEFVGSWMETRRGRSFQAYRGIKYAEPPVGELRFQPPVPILQYKEQVDASKDGPAAPQPAPEGYYIDEDCLRINVYTPDNNSSKLLPVIFFIHPGGFYSMSGRSDLAGPHYLLDRDLVVVTINYRLGSLGFMSTGEELAPGNNGLKDQVVALKWVQRNIASFGGDPNLVTITGCSAGSISVMLHMVSPMSKGLFHRAISMSASPIVKAPLLPHQRHLAVKQAELLKCPSNSTKEIYDCLKTKPWKELGDSLRGFFATGYDPIGAWTAVVEPDFGQERFLDMQPLDALRQGRVHTVPYIVTQTTDEFYWVALGILRNATVLKKMNEEWESLAPYSLMLPEEPRSGDVVNKLQQEYLGDKELRNDEATARGLGRLYGDAVVGFGVHRLANLMCKYSKHPVYYGEFAYVGNHSHYEDPVTKKPIGAAHHDDLIYLFTLSYQFPTIEVSDSEDSKMVDRMTALWYNFARYGDPNPRDDTSELGDLSWPRMTPQKRSYLHLGEQFTVRENYAEDRFKLWEELYPIQY